VFIFFLSLTFIKKILVNRINKDGVMINLKNSGGGISSLLSAFVDRTEQK